MKNGQPKVLGHIVELPTNKNINGLGFLPYMIGISLQREVGVRPIQEVFHSVGFIHLGE